MMGKKKKGLEVFPDLEHRGGEFLERLLEALVLNGGEVVLDGLEGVVYPGEVGLTREAQGLGELVRVGRGGV